MLDINIQLQQLMDIVGGRTKIVISHANKVNGNGTEIVFWEGITDDYFKNRPYGEWYVWHITVWDDVLDQTLRIMIDEEPND